MFAQSILLKKTLRYCSLQESLLYSLTVILTFRTLAVDGRAFNVQALSKRTVDFY